MAFTPVTNCIELVIEGTQWGEERRTVLHSVTSGTVTNPDVDEAVELVGLWLQATSTIGLFHPTVTFQGIKGTNISEAGGYQTYFNMANAPGQNPYNPALPGNVSCCVSLRTATGGRSGRGRIYHYGLTSHAIDGTDGNWFNTGDLGDIHTAYVNLMTTFDDAVSKLAVASRLHGVAYPVTSVTVDKNVDSMRRRLAGRGR